MKIDQAKVLDAVSESLRRSPRCGTSLRSSRSARRSRGEMLDEIERDLLDAIADIDKDRAP
jgi:hypothetical protein